MQLEVFRRDLLSEAREDRIVALQALVSHGVRTASLTLPPVVRLHRLRWDITRTPSSNRGPREAARAQDRTLVEEARTHTERMGDENV